MSAPPEQIIDKLFRSEYARLVSLLVAKYRPEYMEFIEDAVQEGLLKATKLWGYAGVPNNPSAWLYRVSHNALLDRFRKENRTIPQVAIPEKGETISYEQQSTDSQLQMIFACCHPDLSQQDQLVLSLKILGGLSLKEIARGLLKSEEAVKKDYQRARVRFKDRIGTLELPSPKALTDRLGNVQQVIYLLFNEGYKASSGEDLIKRDICEEALALALMLTRDDRFKTSDTHALIALMYFNMARFDSRTDTYGLLIPLAEQNRSQWNSGMIEEGFRHLDKAQQGVELSKYQLEACIASVHAGAPSYDETRWDVVLQLYNKLYELTQSPLVALNRIVALAEIEGPEHAISELERIAPDPILKHYYLTPCIRAEMYQRLGRSQKAIEQYKLAETLTTNVAEHAFIRKKREELKRSIPDK